MASTHLLADNAEPVVVYSWSAYGGVFSLGLLTKTDNQGYSSSVSTWICDKTLTMMVGCCWSGHKATWMNLITGVGGTDGSGPDPGFGDPGGIHLPGEDPVESTDTARIQVWPSKWASGYNAGDPLWSDILIDPDGVRYITNEVEMVWAVDEIASPIVPLAIGIWDGPSAAADLLYWQSIDEQFDLGGGAATIFVLNEGVFKLREEL